MGSIWSDENRFRTWLNVEVLACEAWGKLGKIPSKDVSIIKKKANFDIKRINEIEAQTHHDLIAFVTTVQEFVGPSGRFIHIGLTSSDVVDTALSVMMKDAVDILIEDVRILIKVIETQAKKYKNMPMMGRTHGIHAEPITLGLKFALMLEEFRRAEERLLRAKEIISFGKISGAVGTFAHIDPFVENYVCKNLGLTPAPISTQIIQRDRHAEYLSMIALVADSLERWATEIRGLQKTELREVEEPFRKGQKGSSAMPHKRNPVISERICGMARMIRGYSLTAHENVALWHERDISHSSAERVILPDATIALDYMLVKMIEVVKDLNVYPENMQRNIDLTGGIIFSQRVLLSLVNKGISRDDAYKIVQDNAMRVWKGEGKFLDLLLKDDIVKKYLSEKELKDCFDIKFFLKKVDVIFKRVGLK
jgi:adenylosuccinate lyase